MPRRTTAERARHNREVPALLEQGWAFWRIADHLHISESTARRIAKDHPPREIVRAQTEVEDVTPRVSVTSLAQRGRVSRDRADTKMAFGVPVPPSPDGELNRVVNVITDWRKLRDPTSVMLILARHSPEISKAWWDLLLMSVAGWEIKAKLASDRREDDEKAQKTLDEILDIIGDRHGSLHNLFTQFITNAFFRGALAGELVLGRGATSVADLVAIDPNTCRFRPMHDPILGDIWELGQIIKGEQQSTKKDANWISLDIPTVKYLPLHPLPSEPPYGTPPAGPAAMPAIFLLGVLYDIKRVIEKQGFGRLDITVDTTKIAEKMGKNARPAAKDAAVSQVMDNISRIVAQLLPDDVLAHTDDIVVNRAPGVGGESGAVAGMDRLIDVMEKQVIRALKSMPLIQGVTDSVSEGNANRQWEVYAKGVRVLQQNLENLLSYFLELALGIYGVNAFVEVRFAEIRAVDEYREAQMRLLKTQIASAMESYQYMTPDEAAMYATGKHGIPEELLAEREEQGPPSRPTGAPNPAAPEQNNPDAKADESGQKAFTNLVQLMSRGFTPEGSGDAFPSLPNGTPTPLHVEQARTWFNELLTEAEGVLEAEVV